MAPVIRMRGVAKRYGRTVALDGVDLDVRRGIVFGYLPTERARPPSGC